MNWAVLIPIIASYGIPLAQKLWDKWQSNQAPTAADWDELNALASKTAMSQMTDALNRAGFAVDSPEAKALLELLKVTKP